MKTAGVAPKSIKLGEAGGGVASPSGFEPQPTITGEGDEGKKAAAKASVKGEEEKAKDVKCVGEANTGTPNKTIAKALKDGLTEM